MARTRHTLIALLAVSVLAVGCGGNDPAEEDPQPTESGVSTRDDDELTTAASDSAEQPEETDIGAVPEREPQPEAVQLGDRFPWCADFRRDWDEQTQLQAQVNAAEAALQDALDATQAATDELDQAEAVQAFVAAEQTYADLMPAVAAANRLAVRSVKPDWSTHEETEAIAVERAREEFYLVAAPALIDLMEAAIAASREGWEPSPTTAAAEQDETRNQEELLAALQQLHVQVDEWWQQGIAVQATMQDALSGIHEAQNPRDAVDAYARFLEAAQLQGTLYQTAWDAYLAAGDLHRAYRLSVGDALDAGEIGPEESDARVAAAYEVYEAIGNISRDIGLVFSHPEGWIPWHEYLRVASRALETTADRFILADPAWAAFQRSLSESCKQ